MLWVKTAETLRQALSPVPSFWASAWASLRETAAEAAAAARAVASARWRPDGGGGQEAAESSGIAGFCVFFLKQMASNKSQLVMVGL